MKSEKVKNPHTRVFGFFGRRTWNRHARQGRGARVCLTAICRHFASKNANVAAARLRLAVISRYPLSLPNKKGTRCVPFLFWQGQKDLNPRPMVLETSTLPTELYPCTVPDHSDLDIISHLFLKCNSFLKKSLVLLQYLFIKGT